ncbi:MAG: bifunctional [glutamate--ammonia ligase]-adenylyl-L-tyrosine phosphorylase/[glutamate--ammonia-ligase] adenylyltransferase [Gammaproteobacteria bacterium]|nr:bifunctional [glutamate--ammonia ligase]-adenylyl-L-tyrosine phosphorylase/[glutamate--ammonia-ligase] adenylyltransferase [Gammaproteobacteria bacterium]
MDSSQSASQSASQLPKGLADLADRFGETEGLELPASSRRIMALSDFAQRVASQQREWFLESLAADRFEAPWDAAWFRNELTGATGGASADVPAVDDLKREFRRLRNRSQLWIVWRHLAGTASLEETVRALSDMADGFVAAALEAAERRETERVGEPRTASGEPQRLAVFALGKLGGRELNLSSDVDLIFGYPEDGQTSWGVRNQQYFIRVGQGIIDLLHPVTVDGFVFRVDMRLRPYGASGPLVMHFAAMREYFESQGRSWERYALIKARVCAGDRQGGEELLNSLKPFVYRRYLDFGSLEAMREMKARLAAERHRPEDVKLGPGGIRYAEFAVQVQQLVLGGRFAGLQHPGFLDTLAELERAEKFDPDTVTELRDSYRFLRDTEHCIQAEADRQTQRLPVTDTGRLRLAFAMGFESYAAFLSSLARHRDNVERIFDRVIGAGTPQAEGGLWTGRDDFSLLAEEGFDAPRRVAELLRDLAEARDRSSVGEDGRQRLDLIMPEVLQVASRQPSPARAVERLVPIFKTLLRRSTYLALLRENPEALEIFVRLVGQSRWVADQIAAHPVFMEVMLDKHAWDLLSGRDALVEELGDMLAAAPDEEALVDALREFKEQRVFRVAAAEARGLLPIMHVSDYLSWLAEAVLEHAIRLAWEQCASEPDGPRPFIAVGYGKLGGQELGLDSDLDLVFLHDLPRSASQFLHRMVRKLMHLLTVRTYTGPLYEIDMRLRPSGSAGLMVSSLASFREYQTSRAWVWEQQALIRARAVAGDPALMQAFESTRRELLCQPRPAESLRREVREMRKRIDAQHRDEHDLKRGVGGIVDLEFIVQYLVLAQAHAHPNLATWSDNVRILEEAGIAGVLPEEDAERLVLAYLALRGEVHHQTLDLPESEEAAARLTTYRQVVCDMWERLFDESRSLDLSGR